MTITPLAHAVLLSCLPMIFVLFAVMPPRRAVIASAITAWLFMPNASYSLPGLPDYSKSSATSVGCLLCIVLFDFARVVRFRPKWFDIPICIFCTSVIMTAVANDLSYYDGLSQSLRWVTIWGIPYFIGRLYLGDFDGCRDFALGIVIGGLVYVPLCLWEVRFSPQLQRQLYGTIQWWEDTRYGSYRPIVFLATGLEVGMWMTAASLCAYWLRTAGVVKQICGIPMGWVLTALVVTTVLCKSVGAIFLLIAGVALLEAIRWTKSPLWVLILLVVPPVYVTARAMGLWSGRELGAITGAVAGSDRQQSLEFRLENEDLLVAKALQKPVWGWGGYGRNFVRNEVGRTVTVADGLWIVILGTQGIVGLVMVMALYLLPVYFLYKRFPVQLWFGPLVAPVAVLSVLMGLYMLDNLSNAMVNPAYAIAAGGLMALKPGNLGSARRIATQRVSEAAALKQAGEYDAAEMAFGQAIGFYAVAVAEDRATPEVLAEMAYSYESLADLMVTAHPDRADEAEACLRRALEFHEALVTAQPFLPAHRERLALDLEHLGRFLATHNRVSETRETWGRALAMREGLAAEFPREGEFRRQLADSHNDLAWLLANHPQASRDDIWEAVRQASKAVELEPAQGAYYNTLGAANYHAGDYRAAAGALHHSVDLTGGGTGFDHFLLAMAHARLGEFGPAIEWFQQAETWMQASPSDHPELAKLRNDAAILLHT